MQPSWPKGKREGKKTDEQKAEAEETRRLMRFQTWSSPGCRRRFRVDPLQGVGVAVGSDFHALSSTPKRQAKLAPCVIRNVPQTAAKNSASQTHG